MSNIFEVPVKLYSESRFGILQYRNEIYKLIELTKKQVLSVDGSNEKNTSEGAMAINGNTIFHYGIKKEYLKYAIIQEILSPDMINGFQIDSIKTEIEKVPKNILEDYIKWRISFFGKMKEYWDGLSDDNLINLKLLKSDKEKYSKGLEEIITYLYSI